MSKIFSPRIVQDGLVMCLDASQNKSYPTDLPVKDGLVMWMDAADDTTFSYSSGTTVSQWRDKSGFNYHMTPLAGSPTRNAFQNSRKVVAFTTAQDIQNTSIDLRTSPYTVFIVSRYTSPSAGTGRILTSNGGYNNWLLGHWASETNKYYANGWVYQTYAAIDINWKLYLGDWGGSSNNIAAFYTAGTSLITNSANVGAGPWTLGINANSGERSNCEAAEIIVFNRLLSTVERRLVHTYLGQKWGISNTDRSVIDLSGYDDNGLLGAGTTTYMPAYDYYDKGSLKFDGSDDYVDLGTNSALTSLTNNITVEAWIKIPVSTNRYTIYGNGYSGTGMMFGTSANTPGGLEVYYPTIFVAYSTAGVLQPNVWQHVVYTRNGSGSNTHAFYINGVSQAVTQTANGGDSWGTSGTNRYLGFRGGVMFNGQMSTVRVYNRALSAAEVAQNYEAQKARFANTIVQQGLVLNLDASNPYSYAGVGATWYDVSGNSFNATLIKTPTYSSDNGGVLNWNGVDQYATVPMSSTLRVTSITQEVWVYLSSTADQVFIGSQYGTGSNNSFALWISGGTFYFGVNTGGTFYASSFSTPSIGVWYHLVHTYGGSSQSLYINGSLIGVYSSAATGNIAYDVNNTKLAIGADFNGTGYDTGPTLFVNGKMPVVRIYNIALSAAQVLQNYNATKGRFGL